MRFNFTNQKIYMLYMIIERFRAGKTKMIYQRFAEKGRLMPEGVKYINSWVTKDMEMCYQVMDSITEEKIREWISKWDDLSDFEVIPVIGSDEAKASVLSAK